MSKNMSSQFYRVKNSGDMIRLSVKIGHGQKAVTRVYLGENQIGPEKFDSFAGLEIGKDNELKNRTLRCATTVHDINPATDMTSITAELAGGVKDFSKTMSDTVDESGGVIFYDFFFDFI